MTQKNGRKTPPKTVVGDEYLKKIHKHGAPNAHTHTHQRAHTHKNPGCITCRCQNEVSSNSSSIKPFFVSFVTTYIHRLRQNEF